MRIRRVGIVVAFLLAPAVASADAHRADGGGGYSEEQSSALHGFFLTAEWVPKVSPKMKYLSIMGDFSWNRGDHAGSRITRTVLMFGASVDTRLNSPKHVASAHWLVGGVGNDGLGRDDNKDLATAVGAAYQFVPVPKFALRLQYDHIVRADGADDFNRFFVGGIYRWLRK